MISTIQLQPHTTSNIPLHIESPESLSARTAIEIHMQESAITDAIMATLTRNDETGQILIPTLTLTEFVQKKFLTLETLEPHTMRDYVLTLKPIDNLPLSLQRQSTPMEITYGIEAIASSQQISPQQQPLPSPVPLFVPLPSPTSLPHLFKNTSSPLPSSTNPTPNLQKPQVLGVSTAQASTHSAIHLNTPPKLPPTFFILLFTVLALIIFLVVRNSKFAPRIKKYHLHKTNTEHLLQS